MSLNYATANDLNRPINRWSRLVSYQPQPWTYVLNPAGNLTATGVPQTWVFEKTGGGSGWNSAMYGTVGYNTGTIIWRNPATGAGSIKGALVMGLSATPSANTSYTNATFGLSLYQGANTVETYNAGGGTGSYAQTYDGTTEFKWVWTATSVTYYINNVANAKSGPFAKTSGQLLYPFVSFNTVGATATVASFSGS